MPSQTILCMKEKVWSLSGDTFHITDQAGVEVLQCRGTTFSLSDRKEFADAQGRPLFALRTKLLALHKTFYGETADGKVLFECKAKFSSMCPCTSPKLIIFRLKANHIFLQLERPK